MLWEFEESGGHLTAKIRNGFLKQVIFELDSKGSFKPSSLATEELEVTVLLETSVLWQAQRKPGFFW